jgi:hypothetical protein
LVGRGGRRAELHNKKGIGKRKHGQKCSSGVRENRKKGGGDCEGGVEQEEET